MTVTLSQHPTVNRQPSTMESSGFVARRVSATPVANLVDTASDLTFCRPGDIGRCEDCMKYRAVAVAVVSWPDPDEDEGRDEISVCRDCLARASTAAADRCDVTDRPVVEMPAWTLDDLADAVGVTGDVITGWDVLVAEDGPGGPCYLADEVVHARRLRGLVRAGVTPTAADRLLRGHPELTRAVEQALGVAA